MMIIMMKKNSMVTMTTATNTKEDVIRLMAASIYGGLVIDSPNELRKGLMGIAIRQAEEMYDMVPRKLKQIENERYDYEY